MKKHWIVLGGLALVLSSCESKTGQGAIVGGALGALGGGLIAGNATGAVIGGAIGATAGALVGSALDEQDKKTMQQNAPQTLQKIESGQQLSIYDVEAMSKNGLSDNVIIGQIQSTHSVFHLSSEQIIELKNAGVSEAVIEYMIQTGRS
jgi:outer membrane lipoprotein SlyB